MSTGPYPYSELVDLGAVVLEESWITAIVATPGAVRFEGDFVLTEQHPGYHEPLPDEQFSYQRATLLFSGVTTSLWSAQGAPPAVDEDDQVDYGHIDSLRWDAQDRDRYRYVLDGDWGHLELVAAQVTLIAQPVRT